MKLGKFLLKLAKNTLLMGAVGAALAVAAPYLAAAVGFEGSLGLLANPGFQALFFGSFGAGSAACGPVMDKLFGDNKPEEPKEKGEKLRDKVRTRLIILRPQPAQEQQSGVVTINHHHDASQHHNEFSILAAVDASQIKQRTKTTVGAVFENPDARTDNVERLEKRRAHQRIEMAGNELVH